MLNRLLIKNVALIDRAEIEFGPRLNVLSGETGAGKSVILDSINFVLGAKADKSMIRYGENECSVSAVFAPEKDNPAFGVLQEMDIDADEEIVISRRYRQDGRGDIKINGCSANASMLRRVTAYLVDVHGQSEHFYLLGESNQLKLLDKEAGPGLTELKRRLGEFLQERNSIQSKLQALGGDEAERGRRLDILMYQANEIEQAHLQEGEEETLAAKKHLLANAEKIMRALTEASACMSSDGAAIDRINSARRSINDISEFDSEYRLLAERMESLAIEAEDLGETITSCAENLTYDEHEAEEIEERLDLIRSLKKKYGDSVSKIVQYGKKIADEIELLTHSDEEYSRLSLALEKNKKSVFDCCKEISQVRHETAVSFCKEVEDELKTLNIKHARFCADFQPFSEEDIGRAAGDGLDRMDFMFSANAGEPLKPLNKVISGGEMSRLMLAIKTKTSDANGISTYIFDEIDAGISGATAKIVAEKFADISKRKQIIAVSHLAQIVAMADDNFLISKQEDANGKTLTRITALDHEERFAELVRLLGGTAGSSAARLLAEELSAECLKYKQ